MNELQCERTKKHLARTRSIICVIIPLFSLGLIIYFGYGIWHSTEATLAHSSIEEELNVYKPACSLNRDSVSPEKEAFLCNRHESRLDEEGDL